MAQIKASKATISVDEIEKILTSYDTSLKEDQDKLYYFFHGIETAAEMMCDCEGSRYSVRELVFIAYHFYTGQVKDIEIVS